MIVDDSFFVLNALSKKKKKKRLDYISSLSLSFSHIHMNISIRKNLRFHRIPHLGITELNCWPVVAGEVGGQPCDFLVPDLHRLTVGS